MERNCSHVPVIVFLVYYHCFMFSFVISAMTRNNTTDQQALLSLKDHLHPNDPQKLLSQNWSSSDSVCNWLGVSCGVRHRRVTALNISYIGLTGTIPPQLGNLSFLTTLAMQNNSFYGAIPDELAQLRRLKSINLNFNNLDAEIPSWFGSLHKLQELLLQRNNFIGSIPASLGNISSLEILDLSYNKLSGAITKEFENLTQLRVLSLRYNSLKGEIPQELGNLRNLEILLLSLNALIGPIPSPIFNLSSLTNIDFTYNNLTGHLPDNMCQTLPALQGLFLSGNLLNGSIPHNLWKCRELRRISLSANHFEGRIPRDIGNLTSATLLSFGQNNLIGGIPYEIGNLPNLQILGVQFNNLEGIVPATIFNISTLIELALTDSNLSGNLPSSTGLGLPNLERLYLGLNNFNGTISCVTNASKLTILDMGDNSFSGFIPDTIGDSLRSLNILSLSGNYLRSSSPDLSFLSSLTNCKHLRLLQLTGNPLDGMLPNSIGNLSLNLETFAVDKCSIRGGITEEIGNLNNLTVLRLGRNELTGSIPVTLGRLEKLQGLYLESNKLQGLIPDDLCHLNNLVDLYLGGNKLSGSIPACLGGLTGLRDLSLGSNGLTSFIPSTLCNLKDILHLNLSSNSLNGSLPSEFGNLKVLIDVDLSWNHLSGKISAPNIEGLVDLTLLNLSHNRFQGPIPRSFGELTSLEFLDLSNNDISGEIPKSLERLLYLKYLNLSFNRLQGEVPSGGAFVNFSAESFMGNFALCGLSSLHLPPCKRHTRRSRKILVITLSVCVPSTLLAFALIFLSRRRQKRSTQPPADAHISLQPTWRRISYQEIEQATQGFSETNLLGTGSFGSVYKGRLQDGMEVAIKVFHLQHEGAVNSFEYECEIISRIRHRNLVKIISCCSNYDFKAIVLEYMCHGSLDKCLYSNNCILDILQRLNIMIDVASALEYLHFGYSPPIVHCDLKPSNVLVDQSMVGHLSDFGIAKLLGEQVSMTQTQTLATIGYIAPEYGKEGKVTRRCDVYSFGIMLMETFTRKKPTDEIFTEKMSLKTWVGESLYNTVMEVVDTNLLRREDEHFSAKEQCISSIFSLAMECSRESPETRIDIKEVANRLLKIRATLLENIQGVGYRMNLN